MASRPPQGIGAGVVAGGQPQPQQAQPPRSAPGDEQEGGKPTDASPEEQAQYNEFVDKALDVIYPATTKGEMSPALAAQLQGQFSEDTMNLLGAIEPPLDPANAQDCIAATAVMLCLFLDASAQQAGIEISDDVMFNAGAEIVEILASDGEAAGFFEVSDEETENAFYRACDIFRTTSPRVDQQVLAQQFNEIVDADHQGQLKKLLPTLPTEE